MPYHTMHVTKEVCPSVSLLALTIAGLRTCRPFLYPITGDYVLASPGMECPRGTLPVSKEDCACMRLFAMYCMCYTAYCPK